ncbi:MAG: glycosyltransferase [candidate division NC10 bacterium]|nr:glycosyltransferase [candidate division NC10 bacterium]
MSVRPVVAHFRAIYLQRSETFIYRYLSHLTRVWPVVFAQAVQHLDEFPVPTLETYPPLRWSAWGIRDRLGRRQGREPFLAWRIRRLGAVLLHAHFGPQGHALLPLRRQTGLPMVTSFYGYDMSMLPRDPEWRARYADLFAGGDCFLVEGRGMKERLAALGCPPEKIRLQRIAIDLDLLPFRERRGHPGPVRLLFCARFSEKKGLLDALRAAAAARDRGVDLAFRIVGDGELRDEVERTIQELRLERVVQLLGMRPYADVLRELESADLLIQPSRTAADGDTEGGAPTILLEAQASGLPVLSTRHADIPDVVAEGKSALLAPEGDWEALADHLAALCREPERWAEMGRAGRGHVAEAHDIRAEARRLEEIYFGLAGIRGSG